MYRLLLLVGTTIGSYIGWWVGGLMGFELMGKFIMSCVGMMGGVFAAWKVLTEYIET
jgi:hypothetical protein